MMVLIDMCSIHFQTKTSKSQKLGKVIQMNQLDATMIY